MKTKLLFIALLISGFSFDAHAQLLQWNTFGNFGTETTEPSVANDANIGASILTFGPGVTAAANANRFGGSDWFDTGNTVTGNTLAEAITGNNFIQFVVTPNSGFSFTPTSLVFRWDRSGTGPSSVTLRSSADSYALDLGTVTGMISGAALTTDRTITISGLANITTATTFRLYGYGATATGGTGGFDIGANTVNVVLNGTTSSSTPPAVILANNITQIAAANVPQGTTNHILSTFQTTVANAAATLTTAAFATSGTYLAADIVANGFTLWRNSTGTTFAGATAIGTLNSTATGSGDILIFSPSPTVSLPVGVSYFWVTANIAAAATAGRTMRIDAIANADLTFSSGTKSGSASVAGFQTITITPPAVPGSLIRGCTTNTTQVLTFTAPTTGSYDGYLLVARQGGVPNAVTSIFVPTQSTNLDFSAAPTYNATTSRVLFKTTAAPTVTVTVTGLTTNLPYTFAVYAYKNNGAATLYSATAATTTPTINLPNVTIASTTAGNTSASLTWANPSVACFDQVLVVVTATPGITFVPTGSNNTAYSPNTVFAGFNQAVYYSSGNLVNITGLTNGVTYYLELFVRNGSEWSSGVEVPVTPLNINPTALKTGDLVLIAYDNNLLSGDDGIRLLTMVDVTQGTSFLWANATYETGGLPAANVRNDRWFECTATPNGNVPFLEFTYTGITTIPAGSVFCITTIVTSTASTISAISPTGTSFTSFTLAGKRADGTLLLTNHADVNVATGAPDSMFLLQGNFIYNVLGSTFVGTVLSGVQDGGAWYELADNLTGATGNQRRISRKHPKLLCASLQARTNTTGDYRSSYDLSPNTGNKQFLLFEILNYAGNWTNTFGVCPSPSPFSISGSDAFNRWTGATSTNWFDCNNWAQLSVPDEFTDVVIFASMANNAVIAAAAPFSDQYLDIAKCRDLTISGRKVQVEGNANNKLEVHGNLLINTTGALDMEDAFPALTDGNLYLYKNYTNSLTAASFEEGNGTVSFVGSLPQIINNNVHTNPEQFFNVILDNDFNTTISNDLIASGDLEVKTNKFVTIGSAAFPNDYVRVNNQLTNNGDVIIESGGQLIQVNDTDTNIGDYTGTKFTVKRNYTATNVDYVYWGAPTKLFAVATLPNGFRYEWNPLFANTWNGTQGNWIAPSTANMTAGKGYIARTFNGSATPITLPFSFRGQPNNGSISVPISRGSYFGDGITTGLNYTLPTTPNPTIVTRWDDNWNLISNPYPSAINAVSFLNDPNNSNIEGFVYLWTHQQGLVSTVDPYYYDFGLNYSSAANYILYNASGVSSGPVLFDGKIASGQGFFVLMSDGPSVNGTLSVAFNNSMRYTTSTVTPYNNSQFYRTNTTSQAPDGEEEKHRMWLDIISEQGDSNRTLVGYIENATNDKDRVYDAVTTLDNSLKIVSYSSTDAPQEFVIQGRSLPFDSSDTVPLGVGIPSNGIYKIAIAYVDGLFAQEQPIYVEDKTVNIIHDLRQAPYSFTATAGRFDDRFVLRYTNTTLANPTFETLDNSVIVSTNRGELSINSYIETMQEVTVFDILGRQLFEAKSINNNNFVASDISVNQQALIVKIKLNNGTIVTRKIIL